MKVLALVTEAFGGPGGIAQYNRDFLRAAAETGFVTAIEVVARRAPDEAPLPRIHQSAGRPGRLKYSLLALREAIRLRPAVIFCGHLYMAPLAAVLAKLMRASLIVQAHGIESWPKPGRLQRRAVDSADLVLCVSRYTRARVLEWAMLPEDRVIVIPNTVAETFTPGDGSTFRIKAGIENAKVLLTVGRMDALERYKGHDRVMSAMPTLLAQGFDVQYLVIGDGSDRSRLEGVARTLGVADRVHFLGTLDGESLRNAYRAADLFVMPSTGEGFGIAFVEAMASGTPALGLAVAGACDALADGALGMAVPEHEFEAALLTSLSQPARNGTALARATSDRFGRARFSEAVRSALARAVAT